MKSVSARQANQGFSELLAAVDYLMTEALQDGRLLDGVRFVNPFDGVNNAIVDAALPP
jgi:hypothetical protein